ncbi:MAG: D-aminoacyl-tRNA deacylase [Clostridia bacterium]|nr:D-aminoacyl-tRNA deacylase [Clostridia bacterium]
MKVVLQRVSFADVKVDGKTVGKIDKGILCLVGVKTDDIGCEDKISKMADKIVNMRIFEDENEKMNLSLKDIDGELLVISQFTLYGDASHGNRPSYIEAARPEDAEPYYEKFVNELKNKGIKKVECGVFGADMKVSLLNDGPVTIVYEL